MNHKRITPTDDDQQFRRDLATLRATDRGSYECLQRLARTFVIQNERAIHIDRLRAVRYGDT
jgi:hypothetical protein